MSSFLLLLLLLLSLMTPKTIVVFRIILECDIYSFLHFFTYLFVEYQNSFFFTGIKKNPQLLGVLH
ncbi:hypothetical protein J3Q64DRAFT_1724778 [Phycomyces blakesleeanus]|uniref:Uncharacterized protein n=1 Tax=Phycomyces blakesleeanus TaxID=4837 RepID=A0ABR3B6I8_PHYBL